MDNARWTETHLFRVISYECRSYDMSSTNVHTKLHLEGFLDETKKEKYGACTPTAVHCLDSYERYFFLHSEAESQPSVHLHDPGVVLGVLAGCLRHGLVHEGLSACLPEPPILVKSKPYPAPLALGARTAVPLYLAGHHRCHRGANSVPMDNSYSHYPFLVLMVFCQRTTTVTYNTKLSTLLHTFRGVIVCCICIMPATSESSCITGCL